MRRALPRRHRGAPGGRRPAPEGGNAGWRALASRGAVLAALLGPASAFADGNVEARASAASGLPASAASAPPVNPDCTRPLSLGLNEHGLLYSTRTGEGIDKDIAEEMIRRSGCRIQLTVLSRARIWQLLESGTLDFSLSAVADDSRDRFAAFAWYEANKYYLLVRRDAHVQTVEDFGRHDGLKLGVIRSIRYSPQANQFVDRLDTAHRVTYATGFEPLFQILFENQIQAMLVEPVDYPAIEALRLRDATTILEFDDAPVPHGLVMSKRSLAPEQQQAWRELILAMRADGTMRRIFEKYLAPDIARAMTQF
jgi:polar amino acid transport system substrate-binding protein